MDPTGGGAVYGCGVGRPIRGQVFYCRVGCFSDGSRGDQCLLIQHIRGLRGHPDYVMLTAYLSRGKLGSGSRAYEAYGEG